MLRIRPIFKFLTIALMGVMAMAQDAKKGESLFKQHCTACHALEKVVVGPALKGVNEKREKEWLHKWIKNSKAFIASGDKDAVAIFEEFKKTEMTAFEGTLSDADIDDVLEYIKNPPAPAPVKTEASADAKDDGSSNGLVIIAMGVLAAMLLLILFRLNELVKLTNDMPSGSNAPAMAFSLSDFYAKYQSFMPVGIVLITLLSLYGVWIYLLGIGVDKGYQPEQPIYFSHKIHAGINGIDCQYCHSSAKYGHVSGIPSVNVCMNRHVKINEYTGGNDGYVEEDKDKAFYTAEIQKIYEAVGYDVKNRTYRYDADSNRIAGKPIEWIRIHNMPAFVKFNHSTHVVAGESAIKKAKGLGEKDQVCFACHGQVNEMDEVSMANDFTMGWCIECHRTTEVDMNTNYNSTYFKHLHQKLSERHGKDTKVTVDAIGGMECGKCHY